MNQVSCGNCQNPLQYPPELAGKKIRCPKCKEILALPAMSAQPTPAGQPRPSQQRPAPTKPQQTVSQQPVKQRTASPQPNRQPAVTPQPQAAKPQAVTPKPAQMQPVQQPAPRTQPIAQNPAVPQQPAPLGTNDPFGQPMAPLGGGNDPFAAQPVIPQAGIPQAGLPQYGTQQPGMPQPLGQPQPIPTAQPMGQPGMPQPLGQPQPMGQPGMGQPGMVQPMAYQQPAWQQQQPKKKKGSSKALKQGLIWGGAGAAVITLVILLLVFKPWNLFGGPAGTFNRLRTAMLNENYVVLYDLMTEDAKKKWDDNIDQMINSPLASMSGNTELNELKSLSGRQRFKKMIEIGKQKGTGRPSMTDSQKYELRNSSVSNVEYSDDGKTATLTIKVKQKNGDTKSDKIKFVKDSGGWKIPGGPMGPRFF